MNVLIVHFMHVLKIIMIFGDILSWPSCLVFLISLVFNSNLTPIKRGWNIDCELSPVRDWACECMGILDALLSCLVTTAQTLALNDLTSARWQFMFAQWEEVVFIFIYVNEFGSVGILLGVKYDQTPRKAFFLLKMFSDIVHHTPLLCAFLFWSGNPYQYSCQDVNAPSAASSQLRLAASLQLSNGSWRTKAGGETACFNKEITIKAKHAVIHGTKIFSLLYCLYTSACASKFCHYITCSIVCYHTVSLYSTVF